MLEQSGVLTLLGMGIVFGFLAIMIICIDTLGKVIHAFGLDEDVRQAPVSAAPPVMVSRTSNDAVITAVITAAVTEYRKTYS
jgi:oxaloacetate decarboxylase gamma subunit